MAEEFKMPEQTDQLAIMSAIADVIAEAFIITDARPKYANPYSEVASLCDAVERLRATSWRPDLVAEEMKRREKHEEKDSEETD